MSTAASLLPRLRVRTLTLICLGLLVLAYLCVLNLAAGDWPALTGLWPLSFVGLAGALVANSTGVGGGVVFVPVFSALRETGLLDLAPLQTVGVSFSIQCFGMSVGALTWLNRYYRPDVRPDEIAHRPVVGRIVMMSLLTGLPALLATQYLARIDGELAFLLFKLFSIALGCALIVQIILLRGPHAEREELERLDRILIPLMGLAGGAATALFSVGIGELLALTLFLRRFPVDICVSTAVIVSAVTVWTGSLYHFEAGHLEWGVLVFAAPAVAVGGFLARRLAHALGGLRLKLMTAIWIIGSSAALLFI
ncbi:sulfite exporter TauE/SafE family protein [Maricaulis sp.]|uniref:sulfite exporter TauE/SafE family protein n=1 Tax=Maricaulis sp. TaxID=1486257 RepID=UPI0025B907D8|nr:sulfite exporter TauE/SafE family protein [Maricaulis sp.]